MQKKYNFLFVHDSMHDTFLISNIIELDHLPIKAHFEENPERALRYLSQQAGNDFPNVIIVDVHLPLFDGFEFAERYREAFYYSYPNTSLFLTSSCQSSYDRQRMKYNSVVTDFLKKPFNYGMFSQQIINKLETISV